MRYQWLIPVTIMVLASGLAGCLGGDSDGESEPEYEVKNTGMQLTGNEQGLAQAQPVQLESEVDISLEFDNIIKLTVNVTVEDGDIDTQPDEVGEIVLSNGNISESVNGGNTPVDQQLVVEWDEENYLGMDWTLTLPVTIKGGEDQWPGPFIWRGVPDNGYTYTLDITYEFHDMSADL
ncbi:MAG: hypothetical protein R6V01_03880 [Thermoplasmatota archaeon]